MSISILYEVSVSLDGQQRTYCAMVLYHNGYQSTAELRADFLDNIVGQSALAQAFNEIPSTGAVVVALVCKHR